MSRYMGDSCGLFVRCKAPPEDADVSAGSCSRTLLWQCNKNYGVLDQRIPIASPCAGQGSIAWALNVTENSQRHKPNLSISSYIHALPSQTPTPNPSPARCPHALASLRSPAPQAPQIFCALHLFAFTNNRISDFRHQVRFSHSQSPTESRTSPSIPSPCPKIPSENMSSPPSHALNHHSLTSLPPSLPPIPNLATHLTSPQSPNPTIPNPQSPIPPFHSPTPHK